MPTRLALPNLRRQPTRRTEPVGPVLAAARQINFDSAGDINQIEAARQAWQKRAHDYADRIPELHQAELQLGRAVHKLRFQAELVGPDGKPAPDPHPVCQLLARSVDEMDKDRAARNLFIAAQVSAIVDRDRAGQLRWSIKSIDEFEPAMAVGASPRLVDHPNAGWRNLWEPGTPAELRPSVIEFWKPSRRYALMPWSPTAVLLETCETLTIVSLAMRAYHLHRLSNAGVLYVPSEAMVPRIVNDTSTGVPAPSPMQQFRTAAARTIIRPGTAEALTPIIITGPAQYADAFRTFTTLAAEHHEKLSNDRRDLLETLANGLDWIAGDVNQSSLTDSKFANLKTLDGKGKADYALPYGQLICDGVTRSWYRQALAQLGVPNPERRMIGIDASELTGRQDRSSVALEARRVGLITREATVDAIGFSQEEMMQPGTPEWEDWKEEQAAATGALPAIPDEDPGVSTPPQDYKDEPDIGAMISTLNNDLTGARTAAAAQPAQPDVLAKLSAALNQVDRETETALQAAAELALTTALRRAGSKVVSKANGHKPVRAALDKFDCDRALYASRLGHPVVSALGITEDQMLAEAFDDLQTSATTILDGATAKAAGIITTTLGIETTLTGVNNQTAAKLLAQAMHDLARHRLWHPDPTVSPGETAVSMHVPPTIVTTTMHRAAGTATSIGGKPGAPTVAYSGDIGGTGPATSDEVRRALEKIWSQPTSVEGGAPPNTPKTGDTIEPPQPARGLSRMLVWEHGNPKVPYLPHKELDGARFADFTDPQLGFQPGDNTDLFGTGRDIGGYRPGDHHGCSCRIRTIWLDNNGDQKAGWRKGDRLKELATT